MKVIVTAGIIKYRCRNSNKKEEKKKGRAAGLFNLSTATKEGIIEIKSRLNPEAQESRMFHRIKTQTKKNQSRLVKSN